MDLGEDEAQLDAARAPSNVGVEKIEARSASSVSGYPNLGKTSFYSRRMASAELMALVVVTRVTSPAKRSTMTKMASSPSGPRGRPERRSMRIRYAPRAGRLRDGTGREKACCSTGIPRKPRRAARAGLGRARVAEAVEKGLRAKGAAVTAVDVGLSEKLVGHRPFGDDDAGLGVGVRGAEDDEGGRRVQREPAEPLAQGPLLGWRDGAEEDLVELVEVGVVLVLLQHG